MTCPLSTGERTLLCLIIVFKTEKLKLIIYSLNTSEKKKNTLI